jgi:hypothetical protein
MTTKERDNTWYTEHYLRVMRQTEAVDNDELYEGGEVSASCCSNNHQHQRDLMMAAICIRRGRKLVLTEQARQSYVSEKYPRDVRLREAYQKVSSVCQKKAHVRGEFAAKEAETLFSSTLLTVYRQYIYIYIYCNTQGKQFLASF